MTLDCSLASGSHRSCAGLAVVNGLGAAELIVVIVPPEHEASIAEAVRSRLEEERDARALVVAGDRTAWLEESSRDPDSRFGGNLEALRAAWNGPGDESARRTVLLWSSLDDYLRRYGTRFDAVLGLLGDTLAETSSRPEGRLHRAVLIGGELLFRRLEDLAGQLPEPVRFRYVLVR